MLLLFAISQYKLYKNVLNEKQFRYMKRWHTVQKKRDTLAQNNLLLSFRQHTINYWILGVSKLQTEELTLKSFLEEIQI
jgi:hypothetical protein